MWKTRRDVRTLSLKRRKTRTGKYSVVVVVEGKFRLPPMKPGGFHKPDLRNERNWRGNNVVQIHIDYTFLSENIGEDFLILNEILRHIYFHFENMVVISVSIGYYKCFLRNTKLKRRNIFELNF